MNEIYSCSQLKEAEMYRTMGDISIVVLVDELPTSQFWSLIINYSYYQYAASLAAKTLEEILEMESKFCICFI